MARTLTHLQDGETAVAATETSIYSVSGIDAPSVYVVEMKVVSLSVGHTLYLNLYGHLGGEAAPGDVAIMRRMALSRPSTSVYMLDGSEVAWHSGIMLRTPPLLVVPRPWEYPNDRSLLVKGQLYYPSGGPFTNMVYYSAYKVS